MFVRETAGVLWNELQLLQKAFNNMSLGSRLVLRIVIGMFVIAIVLFLPAGTLRFWQGWAYLAVWFIPGLVFSLYFHKRDPALVERRLQSKEKEKQFDQDVLHNDPVGNPIYKDPAREQQLPAPDPTGSGP